MSNAYVLRGSGLDMFVVAGETDKLCPCLLSFETSKIWYGYSGTTLTGGRS
jgi:hypothetical protein